MDFASAIVHARLEKQLSQRELAARTGVSHSYISHVEAGRRMPSLKRLERIAQVLDLQLVLVPKEIG